ncbi:MAG: hypothetical protein MRY64_04630 [Hyphomonadaceae bacterium]|nr:hypothetical protein [Hyphomonadaceae bacterium]
MSKPAPDAMRALVLAILIDGLCICAGVALYLGTGNLVWLIAGLLLGAGFVLPAIIKFMRARR